MNRLFTKQFLTSVIVLGLLSLSAQATVITKGDEATITGLFTPVSYITSYYSESVSRGSRTCTRYYDGSTHVWESVSGGVSYTQFPLIQNSDYLATAGLSELFTRQTSYRALIYHTNQNECGRTCSGSQYVFQTGTKDAYATVYAARPVSGFRSYLYKNVVSQNINLQFSGAEVIIDGGRSPRWTGGLL